MDTRTKPGRWALVAVGLCAGLARAEDTNKQLLWQEALDSFDGFAYTYDVYTVATLEAARACAEGGDPCDATEHARRERVRSNELPLAHRERLLGLPEGASSAPYQAGAESPYTVLRLQKREQAKPGQEGDPTRWLVAHAVASLPSAEALRNDPDLVARRALNRIGDRDQLHAALEAGTILPRHLDRWTSWGSTLLVGAVARGDVVMARDLLDLGASPDACAASGCPLSIAILLEKPEAVRLLLERKAGVRGGGGRDLPPLMTAALVSDRASLEALLAAGADPLQTIEERVGQVKLKRSLLFFVRDDHAELADWLAGVVHGALARTGRYRWSAWIEQGAKRVPVADGATVTLRAAPFQLVYRADPHLAFRVAGSEDPSLAERSRSFPFRRQLLGPGRVGATGKDASWLNLPPIVFDERGELSFQVSTTEIGWDEEETFGTKPRPKGKVTEYVRRVDTLLVGDDDVKVADYRGPGFTLLLGPLADLGTASDYFEPARVTVRLRP